MNFKLLFLIFLIFGSCAPKKPKVFMFFNKKGQLNVAVIPLKNNSQDIAAGRKIYRILLSRLIRDPKFSPVEEGEIRNFMIRQNIYPGEFFNMRQLRELKKLMNVQIIIGGTVLQADLKQGDVKITLILWATDTQTGKLLWTTYYVKRGSDYTKIMHFGRIYTISELAEKMIDEIVSSWDIKMSSGVMNNS